MASLTAPAVGPADAAALVDDAHEVLERARAATSRTARLALAQVAVVRAAGAVLALRARPARPVRPGGPVGRRSVWDVLARRAPELGEWATYLAVPVDLTGGVPDRVVDDRVRDAERFVAAVEHVLDRHRRCQQGQQSQQSQQSQQGQQRRCTS